MEIYLGEENYDEPSTSRSFLEKCRWKDLSSAFCWALTLIAVGAQRGSFFRLCTSRSPFSCDLAHLGVAKLGRSVGAHEGSSDRCLYGEDPRGMTGHSSQSWELSRCSEPMELLKCMAASEARCFPIDNAWLLKKDLVTALEVSCKLLQLPFIYGASYG